jgi:uncharacterized membrane protein
MKKLSFYIGLLLLTTQFFYACKKEDAPIVPPPINPCDTITITPFANKTHTITGQSLGTITVTSPIGSGFTYSINGATFQASTNFFNLAAGNYTLTVKNAIGCKGTLAVVINGYGPTFYNVRTIINGYCGPCHLNGAISGGKNFDDDASIVSSWDRIKARAVDNLPTPMPEAPNAPLTVLDKQKITDWVNAGHRITD